MTTLSRSTLFWQRQLLILLALAVFFVALVLPFCMAVLWSLVDPSTPWAYPAVLPPVLSLRRWVEIWTTSALPQAMYNSYTLAACVSFLTLLLAMPTAYAFGRMEFPGKVQANLVDITREMRPAIHGFTRTPGINGFTHARIMIRLER